MARTATITVFFRLRFTIPCYAEPEDDSSTPECAEEFFSHPPICDGSLMFYSATKRDKQMGEKHMRKNARAWSLAAISAVVLLGACTKTIEMTDVESFLKNDLAEEVGMAVTSADCPEDVEAEEGGKFDCDVEFEDGTSAVVTMVQKDDEGNIEIESIE